uniref:Putative secreted protein n=1 Tax=Ixodes ricinus TaxID=34613 RepID=A0A6B0USM8_IXORI
MSERKRCVFALALDVPRCACAEPEFAVLGRSMAPMCARNVEPATLARTHSACVCFYVQYSNSLIRYNPIPAAAPHWDSEECCLHSETTFREPRSRAVPPCPLSRRIGGPSLERFPFPPREGERRAGDANTSTNYAI